MEYAQALRSRYFGASRAEKGKMLDEFTQVTDLHRKAAIRLLHTCSVYVLSLFLINLLDGQNKISDQLFKSSVNDAVAHAVQMMDVQSVHVLYDCNLGAHPPGEHCDPVLSISDQRSRRRSVFHEILLSAHKI